MPKRHRVANPEVEEERGDLQMDASPTITRSDIWFRDGNIVLQTEGTQFKVHQGFLEKHSSVFADMFSFPQPEGEGESTVEGCHVVQVYDTPEDIELLLLALYDQLYRKQGCIPFKTISAMIRMGKKYDIRHLRDEGAQRLASQFPSTLEAFEKTSLETWTSIVPEVGLLFKIIALAHQCHIPTILPAAYFRALTNMDALLFGDLLETVSDGVLRSCISGNDKIMKDWEHTFQWLDPPDLYCCTGERREVSESMWDGQPRIHRSLCTWASLMKEFGGLEWLCDRCIALSEERFETGRKATWEKLPSYFGLPGWKDMKDFAL
ncbi:hypothetical protein D9611_007345 [Ephemerocybe angulata]|uniref:BTB domain-containing protein n=1 Tax=Ephemerocybe angulata TaxID=980116 RepID=A0A8H5FL41_9AGAR|nr:hypothetical protein D9611_007345 [Tulosesus angulatus]